MTGVDLKFKPRSLIGVTKRTLKGFDAHRRWTEDI